MSKWFVLFIPMLLLCCKPRQTSAQSETKQESNQPSLQTKEQIEEAPQGIIVPATSYEEIEADFKTEYFKKHPEQKDSVEQLSQYEQNLFWERQYQNKLVELHSNDSYFSTAFQEYVLRDVIYNNILRIDFNLHGPDCGAPDCFSHVIEIPLEKNWQALPQSFHFTESVFGCVEEKTETKGVFEKVAEIEFAVYYFSTEMNKVLEIDKNEDGEYGTPRLHPNFYTSTNVLQQLYEREKAEKEAYSNDSTDYNNYPYNSRQLSLVSYSDIYAAWMRFE